MKIKFNDLYAAYLEQKEEIDNAIAETIDKCDFILGDGVTKVEKEFAEYCHVDYAVGVHSGLSALELSLKALGIENGDEIITVANSFIASALPVSALGAKIVLVDCDEYFLMDVKKLEEAITPKTKCIIPVSLFGQMADMKEIAKFGIPRIEDASQSHGARQGLRISGSSSDIAAFSMYPGKNLGGVMDGGIIVTYNKGYYDNIIKLRNYGSQIKYIHEEVGTNSRLSTLNARVLSVKLKKLDEWNTKRNEVAKLYTELLANIGDVITPTTAPNNYHVWHLYVIRTERRDGLQAYLKEKGIPTQIHYPIPIHQQKCYEGYNFGSGNSFPVTEKLSKEILSLPMHPFLTENEITYICDTVKNFYSH